MNTRQYRAPEVILGIVFFFFLFFGGVVASSVFFCGVGERGGGRGVPPRTFPVGEKKI